MAEQTGFPLQGNILKHTDTILAFNNIDRLENTLSGGTAALCSTQAFHIQVYDRECNVKSNVGYLPTINAPVTSMETINEVLNQSRRIMRSLKLTSRRVFFDQAIHWKALEIKSRNSNLHKPIVLRIGTFQTLCTLIPIIGKRFQDAGIRDLYIQSGV